MRTAKLAIKPLTPKRWGDLAKLFGMSGVCNGCWCALAPREEYTRLQHSGVLGLAARPRRAR